MRERVKRRNKPTHERTRNPKINHMKEDKCRAVLSALHIRNERDSVYYLHVVQQLTLLLGIPLQ